MNSKNSDEIVIQLLEKVAKKKAEINSVEKPRWLTSCTVGYNSDSATDRVNIQTVTDITKLVDLYGFLRNKQVLWREVADLLNIPAPSKWMGYAIDEWLTDIKSRVNQINVNAKKKELEELEARINKLVTVEQRREIELKELVKELG